MLIYSIHSAGNCKVKKKGAIPPVDTLEIKFVYYGVSLFKGGEHGTPGPTDHRERKERYFCAS